VKKICRPLDRIFVAFFPLEGLLPDEVFLFEGDAEQLLFLES